MRISASMLAVLSTFATLLSGHRMTKLPPLFLTIFAPTRRTRMPYDARKFTAERSTMIFCFSVAILLNGNSTTTAPVVSKRPRKATLVMPPARSSTEMSMPHRWPAIHSGAVLAVFPWRRNAQTVPVQKISDRFSGKELTLRGRAACPGLGAVRSEGQRCAADGTVPLRGGPGSAVHRYALLRAAPHRDRTYLVPMRVRGDEGAWLSAATMPACGSI